MKTSIACLVLTGALTTLHATPIADSANDYSGTQGGNGWWYGYYDLTGDLVPGYNPTNDFTQMTFWNGSEWWADALNSYWTSFSVSSGHPNGATNDVGRTLREQWAIRRWVSTVTDTVRIHGHVADASPECGGDGVTAMVFVNGAMLLERPLNAGDTIGFDYNLGVQLHTNDFVDFALSAGCCGDAACDGTVFSAIIDRASFTLNIGTAVEVGVPTIIGQKYQMQDSSDLQTWQPVGDPFTGSGDTMYFLLSTRLLGSPHYFRAQVIP